MRDFFKEYLEYCNIPSDINEHLYILYNLALDDNSVVEFGVGYGRSTRAFMAAIQQTGKSLKSYDLVELDGVASLFRDAKDSGVDASFHQENTIEIDTVSTDILLVDSHHTYEQVSGELKKHASGVRKYIIFHDTVTFGENGQDPGTRGVLPAINEFLSDNPNWTKYKSFDNNNGLLVIQRNG
jgi:cephalosporin hydroxylase